MAGPPSPVEFHPGAVSPATVVIMPVAWSTSRRHPRVSLEDKEVSGGIKAEGFGCVRPGRSAQAAVAAKARAAVACDGRNHAGRVVDLSDPGIVVIRDEQISGGVHRDLVGKVKFRGDCGPPSPQ